MYYIFSREIPKNSRNFHHIVGLCDIAISRISEVFCVIALIVRMYYYSDLERLFQLNFVNLQSTL